MNITEDQEIILNYLSKYSQLLYKFSDYNNLQQWLKDDKKLDETICAVRSGRYKEDDTMEQYINDCIHEIENMEGNSNV